MNTARLVAGDTVKLHDGQWEIGVVERTHEEVESHGPWPPDLEINLLNAHESVNRTAFLNFKITGVPPKDTVMVRWTNNPAPELISQSVLELLDRTLLVGDIVKHNVQDAMSGVVISNFSKCTLQPMGEVLYRQDQERPLKGLMSLLKPVDELSVVNLPNPVVVDASELQYVDSPMEEDVVIYKDHIGLVMRMSYAITLRLMDNCVVEIDDHLATTADDAVDLFYVGDIARTKKGHLRTGKWIYGQYNANTPPVGTVVQTRPISAEVAWQRSRIGSNVRSEPPQVLERDELESAEFCVFDRAKQPPNPGNGSQDVVTAETVSEHEIDLRLGLRLRFKDLASACEKYDGSTTNGKLPRLSRQDNMGYDLNVFDLLRVHAEVSVQWQDLSITREITTSLIPDADMEDANAAWPGEIVHSADLAPVPGQPNIEQPTKVGIVQAVNSTDRMATVKWCPGGVLQYTHDPDEKTGLKTLVSATIGRASGEPQECSLYDIEAPGDINIRRGDIGVITNKRWLNDNNITSADKMDWIGMIVDTRLDGSLLVRLCAATPVQDVVIHREDIMIAIRTDAPDQAAAWADEEDPFEEAWDQDEDEDMSSDELPVYDPFAGLPVTYQDENGEILDEDDVEGGDWESDEEGEDAIMTDAVEPSSPTHNETEATVTKDNPTPATSDQTPPTAWSAFPDAPEQYVILSSDVPASHHFVTQPATPLAVHTKRTHKEHKILRAPGSLPEGVYIRTWESRMDLIRALIIGPEETPYSNAPFIIDFYLPPEFPTMPPRAFFHSWSPVEGGAGRVNPNLYEDGKICLSILGTWEGDRGEGWNAVRSTLLQVIVSLLGLVLVPEPYFNEAGFEHLAGLEASKRPSALYNERIFNRARGFAVTALSRLHESPISTNEEGIQREPSGLEGVADILEWLYTKAHGPRLADRLVNDVEEVLDGSEKDPNGEPDGKKMMSKGACVPLRRTLNRLQSLK